MTVRLTQFEELWSVVKKYNIHEVTNTKVDEIKEFETGEGVDVKLDDVFHTTEGELFTVLTDGSIRKTMIHIVDISSWKEDWKEPRFHIYHCEKIKEMTEKGRKYRYRASSRMDGKFHLIKGKNEWNSSLKICSYCLTMYNEKFKQEKIKNNFIILDYIKQPIRHSSFQKVTWDICTIPNTYVENWNKISKKIKEMCNYKCESCAVDCSIQNLKRFLHTHHVDANKQNNTLENLKVLCIECHAEEDNHGHIKNTNQYKEYLRIKNQRQVA